MARLSRAPPKGVVVDIREDSDAGDTDTSHTYGQNRGKNASRTPRARRGGTAGALKAVAATNAAIDAGAGARARVAATGGKKKNPLRVTRSPTKTRTGANSKPTDDDDDDDDDDDRDTPYPPRTTAQTPRTNTHHSQRQRRQLGPRHTNSLLMPFPAAIGRYDGLTPGRGLGDVENAPLPEQLEEYKYGAGHR
ncbi:hypothetical protein ACJ73_04187, partial [Blastomyces percursus]